MPRARVEREVSNDGNVKTIEIETAAGGEEKGTVKAQYTVPANATKFQEMVLAASATNDNGALWASVYGRAAKEPGKLPSPLDFIYQHYVNSVDKAVRASVYESIQAESTIITVGKDKIDIMSFPLARLVNGINQLRGYRMNQLLMLGVTDPDSEEHETTVKGFDRKVNYNQFQTAARKLVDDGKARENNGVLELVAA